jgi:hypothetical protein
VLPFFFSSSSVPPVASPLFTLQLITKLDIAFLQNEFYGEGGLTEDVVLYILDEPNLLEVRAPITGVCLIRFLSRPRLCS